MCFEFFRKVNVAIKSFVEEPVFSIKHLYCPVTAQWFVFAVIGRDFTWLKVSVACKFTFVILSSSCKTL